MGFSLGGILGGIGGALNPVGLLATGASLGGGILDFIGQKQTNDVNQGIANQANLTQEQYNMAQAKLAQENIDMQREFAQNGIQWRVADAAKAGISPLAALGASEPGFSPVTQAFVPPVTPSYSSPLSKVGGDFGRMGQDLMRSVLNAQSSTDRQLTLAQIKQANANADFAATQAEAARWRLHVEQANAVNPAVPDTVTYMRPDGTTYQMASPMRAESGRGTLFGPGRYYLENDSWPARVTGAVKDAATYLLSH